MARKPKPDDPFPWFDSSPEVIPLVVMLYVRYLGRPGRVTDGRRLEPEGIGVIAPGWRQVAVGLTAPRQALLHEPAVAYDDRLARQRV